MLENCSVLKRRSFISNLSKAGILSLIAPIPLGAVASQVKATTNTAEGHTFLTQPYLQAPAPDSICINWITNKLCYSWVEYGEGDTLDKNANEITDGLVNAYNRINCIKLEGLKPATTYRYRVLSKEIVEFQPYKLTYGETISSDVFSFTTPDPNAKEASWLVLNDIHDRPDLFAHLLQLNGADPYDYVLLNGDMFDHQTGEQQIIDHLIKPCTAAFASKKPFLYARGNHETLGFYETGL